MAHVIKVSSADAIKDIQRYRDDATSNKERVSEEEVAALRSTSQEVQTRHTLTKYFLVGFFGLIVSCFIFVPLYNAFAVSWIKDLHLQGLDEQVANVKLLDIEKVLAVIIGALGSSLGFIIGYYYKEKSK
ncbi:hypothetical protein C4M77_15680 [Escherichia coli]|nr:hypothetical protein C4M77_15680 [Escherichia coli]